MRYTSSPEQSELGPRNDSINEYALFWEADLKSVEDEMEVVLLSSALFIDFFLISKKMLSWNSQMICNLMVRIDKRSLENINIWVNYWPKMAHMPIFCHTFLVITQPFLDQLDWTFLWRLSRLVSIDSLRKSQAIIPISRFKFFGSFWRKIGVVARLGPLNPTKNLAWIVGGSFGWIFISKTYF